MKNGRFSAVAGFLLSAQCYATPVSQNGASTNGAIELPALVVGKDINQQFHDLAYIGVAIPEENNMREDSTLAVEAYVELSSNKATSATCRLQPISYKNRANVPPHPVVEFYIHSPRNEGVNPQMIYSTTSMSRFSFVKVAGKVGGAFYKLQCRRDDKNLPVSLYGNLKLTLVGSSP